MFGICGGLCVFIGSFFKMDRYGNKLSILKYMLWYRLFYVCLVLLSIII